MALKMMSCWRLISIKPIKGEPSGRQDHHLSHLAFPSRLQIFFILCSFRRAIRPRTDGKHLSASLQADPSIGLTDRLFKRADEGKYGRSWRHFLSRLTDNSFSNFLSKRRYDWSCTCGSHLMMGLKAFASTEINPSLRWKKRKGSGQSSGNERKKKDSDPMLDLFKEEKKTSRSSGWRILNFSFFFFLFSF